MPCGAESAELPGRALLFIEAIDCLPPKLLIADVPLLELFNVLVFVNGLLFEV